MPQTSPQQPLIRNICISEQKTWYVLEAQFGSGYDFECEPVVYVKRICLSNGDQAWIKDLSCDDFLQGREILDGKEYSRMVMDALRGSSGEAKAQYAFNWSFDVDTGKLSIKWEVKLERLNTTLGFEHILCRHSSTQGFLNECIKELVEEVQSSTAQMWTLEGWSRELQDLKSVTEDARKRGKRRQEADRKRLCKYAANALNQVKRRTAAVMENKELEEQRREEREDAGFRGSDREDEGELGEAADGSAGTQAEDAVDEASQGSQKSGDTTLVWKEIASPSAAPRAGRRRRK